MSPEDCKQHQCYDERNHLDKPAQHESLLSSVLKIENCLRNEARGEKKPP